MANFGNVIEWVLRLEDRTLAGKIVNLGDGAGWTRFGLTFRDDSNCVSPTFWTTMPREEALDEAKQAYYDIYWTQIQGTAIDDDEVAAEIMSPAVNMGVETAVKLLQRTLGLGEDDVDGVLGSGTLRAIRSAGQAQGYPALAEALREAQEAHYQTLYDKNPTRDAKFIHGWENRARAHYPDLP